MEIPATSIDFFASVTSSVEIDITKKARESFDTKINSAPIEILQKQEWKDRTEFPIGMNEKGDFFYQAENKTSTTKKVKNIDTRNDKHQQEKSWWKFW